ncbi:MAG: spore cortex biosynthesis protein YabQ [Lachnospiraceae bacterium]|nr:spore cortex biosynthesis protein YabQ [Lachnospiraceae bacterium]MBQ6814516.1 spore cortex biosynthesis protein YabQ [Lachnospiraceae bacterium]
MEEYIVDEALLLLNSLYTGLVIMAVYDILRLFRRIIRHKYIIINIEDFIFWILAGFVVFFSFYEQNDGALRWYIIVGVLGGAYIYKASFGRFLVKYASKYINKIINIILKKPLSKAIMGLRYLFRKVVVDNAKKLRKKEEVS